MDGFQAHAAEGAALLFTSGRVTGVKTADGAEHRADLVVVADGRQSKLRAALGLEPEVKLLSYTVVVGFDGALPHGPLGHVFLGAPGPILAYPYGDGRIRFCIDVPLGAAKGRDAMVKLDTISFEWDRPQSDAPGRVFVTGKHIYLDGEGKRQETFVSYGLERINGRRIVAEVGSSSTEVASHEK